MISIYYSPKYERTALIYAKKENTLLVETESGIFEFEKVALEQLLLEEDYYLVGYL